MANVLDACAMADCFAVALANRIQADMSFQLYDEVVLQRDVPDEGLFAGDIGVGVEHHDVAGYETGNSVEFFDMPGHTVSVATLPASALRSPTHADRPVVRSNLMTT
jgi:hypothetical protein